MKTTTCDILFWASIQPNKHGSFEDFICHLARACSQHDLEIVFALGDEITETVANLFREYHVNTSSICRGNSAAAWSFSFGRNLWQRLAKAV